MAWQDKVTTTDFHPNFIHVALTCVFFCVLVPPRKDAWSDARKPNAEKGNEEICFTRNETSFPLKRHMRRCYDCQSALLAVRLLMEFLPMCSHLSHVPFASYPNAQGTLASRGAEPL